jgi:GT2 family glycosyltransferase
MVAVAQGKYILLLNNDAILHPTAVKTLHDASIEHGEGIYGLPQYDAASGGLIDIGSIFDPFLNPIPNKNRDRSDVGMVIGACFWLPKKLWDALGGFPEWFGSLAEDMYLCCLARLKGFPVKVITSSQFSHWVGKSIGGGKVVKNKLSTTLSRRALSERNKTFVMLICYPSIIAWVIIPFHLLLFIVEGVLLAIIKMDKRIWMHIYWFCLYEIWRKRKLWVKQRRIVQHARQCKTFMFLSTFTLLPHKLRMLFVHGIPDVR